MIVKPILALTDNIIWALIINNSAIVVDAGAAAPIIKFLNTNRLSLAGVLITHHHYDHTQGLAELLDKFPKLKIYGHVNSPCKLINQPISQEHRFTISNFDKTIQTIFVPGHTLCHIAYYIHDTQPSIFTGDTLFSAGCGKIFEGTPKMLYKSLQKLSKLDEATLIYCGHEYTLANLKFAQKVEPNNNNIINKIKWITTQNPQVTLPTTLAEELQINPFLRTHTHTVIQAAQNHAKTQTNSPVEILAILREWKNNF